MRALNQEKYRLEESLEDMRGQNNHLQNEVLKVRKMLESAETGAQRHRDKMDATQKELREVIRAIKLVGTEEATDL